MPIDLIVLVAVLGLLLLGLGFAKLFNAAIFSDAPTHFGIDRQLFRIIGAFEVAAGVGVALGLYDRFMPVGLLAAGGLVALAASAIAVHIRAGDSSSELLPAVIMALMAIGYIIRRVLL